jgi:hypothetical protein
VVAAVGVGGRASPVPVAALSNLASPRSPHRRETPFLRLLVPPVRTVEPTAVVRCDRGLRRGRWREPRQERRQACVVRLGPDVLGTTGSRGARLLRAWPRHPGQAVALGAVHLRQDRAVQVRVVGVWGPKPPAPWGLATDRPDPRIASVAFDERRMTVEAQCRETNGCRFGVRLEWTPLRPPAYVARFTLVVGVALVRWTAVGQAVAQQAPRGRRPCQRTGPRLSRRRVGLQCGAQLALLVYSGVRFIRTPLPPPQCRRFSWLQVLTGVS